ncbi:MAG: malate dehydrogenase [Actinomycetota bacterium]
MPKVTVAGAGFVGRTTAMRIAERGIADVCLVDIIENWPQGLALDMRHSAAIQGFEVGVTGANDYGPSAGSDVVVVTAGIPRGPGMSRTDLLARNVEIVSGVAGETARSSPDAVVIVVSNPLDEMTYLTALRTGFEKKRVMGMAGLLDSARLAAYIAEELGVSPLSVEAITLGSHGDEMVPVTGLARVGGRPLAELVDPEVLSRIYQRTVNAGAEVVSLLKKGSAFYAPSAAAAKMAEAILTDSGETIPLSAWVTGQYGIRDVYLGVPARLGRGGAEEIVELDLSDDELARLQTAADSIRQRCNSIT